MICLGIELSVFVIMRSEVANDRFSLFYFSKLLSSGSIFDFSFEQEMKVYELMEKSYFL